MTTLLNFNHPQLRAWRTAMPAELLPFLGAIREAADEAVAAPRPSVTQKSVLAPGATPHDYASLAIYTWPDPDRPDGMPYVHRDGIVNPERDDSEKYDRTRLSRLLVATTTLSLAYGVTGEPRYAEAAADYLRVWFVDGATRMNPHLLYAQAIPGECDGRHSGIIDGWQLLSVVDSVGLIEDSPHWTSEDDRAIRGWFRRYLHWLQNHEFGSREGRGRCNHSTWYDAQTAVCAWFCGDTANCTVIIEGVKTGRIAIQIEPDGSMPRELDRTRPLHYTLFNLTAYLTLVRVARQVGVDLWGFETEDGRSLRRAMRFAVAGILNADGPFRREVAEGKKVLVPPNPFPMARRLDADIPIAAAFRALGHRYEPVEQLAFASFAGHDNPGES